MTITLSWWLIPAALAVVGVVLVARTYTRWRSVMAPSWHLSVGALFLFAAVCIAGGHWL